LPGEGFLFHLLSHSFLNYRIHLLTSQNVSSDVWSGMWDMNRVIQNLKAKPTKLQLTVLYHLVNLKPSP
ncbi:MAG: hypothetical protein PVG97_08750, partial [Syntrophobacterales bacterium]